MRSLTRSTPRLSTSARSIAGARTRRARRDRLASRRLGMGVGITVVTLIVERQIPFENRYIVTGSSLLGQRLEEAVGALLAELRKDLGPCGRERDNLGGLAVGHLEDVEAILGGHQAADLARLQAEDDLGEGGREVLPGELTLVASRGSSGIPGDAAGRLREGGAAGDLLQRPLGRGPVLGEDLPQPPPLG